MEAKFVIISTLLVYLANNQVNSLSINGNLLDKAKECYDKVKEKVQQTIDECVAKLNVILTKTMNLTDRSLKDGSRKITEIADQYSTKLAELENTKNQNCIENIQSELIELRDNTIDDLNKCSKDLVEKAKIGVNTAIIKINRTWDTVEELGANLDACGVDRVCLSKLIVRMIAESVRLPMEITGDFLKTTAQLADLDLKIGACTVRKTLSMTAKSGHLFAKTANCTQV